MSGGKLYPLFAEVRRHAEEGRANVLVSLELLRRQVEVIENAMREREREPERPELTEEDVIAFKKLMADDHLRKWTRKHAEKRAAGWAPGEKAKPTNGRKNRTTRKRKKSAAHKR